MENEILPQLRRKDGRRKERGRMTFNKLPEFGSRFSFPENIESNFDALQMRVTEKILVQMVDNYETAVAGEIASAARSAGVTDCTVLNKKAILDALNKQIPQKPIYVDTRFRNHGRHVGDGVSLDKCYKCPSCWFHIFHVWDSERYCVHCGQALDWSAEPPKEVQDVQNCD